MGGIISVKMGFFDDEDEGSDPFQDIMNEFFGNRRGPRTSSSRNVVRGEKEEREIDYIEEENFVYFVFEFPGFRKEDIEIKIKGDTLNVLVEKKNVGEIKDYLKDKLLKAISFSKRIPVKIKKELNYTFNNGVLEVRMVRK